MSAIPQSSPSCLGASVPSCLPTNAWLPIHVAADRAGISIGAMRNRQKDYPRHLVNLAPPPSGRGCDITWIHQDADPRLARVKSVEQLNDTFNLSAFDEAKRKIILFRERAVLGWRNATAG